MNNFKKYSEEFKKDIEKYKAIFKDPKTPKTSRFFLSLAIGYSSNTLDLIPDVIPLIGHLDDYILIPLFIFLARLATPKSLMTEYHITTH
jgi:uncharacterized membrane protein YkvA (DUF1232 family)